ncbi:hypothetical protein HB779_07510 [Phyllobacterium sp. 628]|uniref:hypothetical protein n=1 Tax=Phyllobacterium sp. 628 TaxID=2718938 RepID=UPI0016628171|nr:hypothetical protein [Phyllobacterium sp. 628]QND51767.1 hypothetical protein HB779_07510 [Phyllobacterium sp. 628]
MNSVQGITVFALIGSAALVSGCVNHRGNEATNSANVSSEKSATTGKRSRIWSNYQVKEDCSSGIIPTLKVTSAPVHGKIEIVEETVSPEIPADNVRYKCNSRKYKAAVAYYTSEPGFSGTDKVSLYADWRSDQMFTYTTVRIKVSK